MSVVIRPARESDAAAVSALLYDIAGLHRAGRPEIFRAAAQKYTAEQFAAIISDENTPVFIAECDGRVSGYIFMKIYERKNHPVINDLRTLYVDDLCVDGSLRGKGIGAALMERAKELARERECFNIELNVWEFNEPAIAFYEKAGYSTQRRRMELVL